MQYHVFGFCVELIMTISCMALQSTDRMHYEQRTISLEAEITRQAMFV